MSFNHWRTQGKLVNDNGQLTTEGYAALQPSTDNSQTVTATVYVCTYQATAYLPSTQSVALKRGGVTVTGSTNNVILNPGDIMTLGSPQTIILMPL